MTLTRTLRDWNQSRRTANALRRLDDRSLHDAGIPRWRIDEIARGEPIDAKLVM